jgi:hypothetical protein
MQSPVTRAPNSVTFIKEKQPHMARLVLLLGFCCLLSFTRAQSSTNPGLQLGMGTSYDYGIGLPKLQGFAPYTAKSSVGAYSFDFFVGIPLGRVAVYPSFITSIPRRSMTIQNLNGDYIPEGYSKELPFSDQNPYVIYGENYNDLSATADIWQRKIGAFALFHLGGGLEIGTGFFSRQKRVDVYSRVMYDEYDYAGSDATKDYYSYSGSYLDHVDVQTFKSNSVSVPIVLQWRYQSRIFYTGTSIIRWVGDGDGYWSFRYSFGFNFSR